MKCDREFEMENLELDGRGRDGRSAVTLGNLIMIVLYERFFGRKGDGFSHGR